MHHETSRMDPQFYRTEPEDKIVDMALMQRPPVDIWLMPQSIANVR
jgi:hypothetical protein